MTFEEMLEHYLKYRAISKFKERTMDSLKTFFNACRKNYPSNPFLTQEMVDIWSEKRDTESPVSHMARISPVISFLHYVIERQWAKIAPPKVEKASCPPYIPHAFSEMELYNFFKACEEIKENKMNYKSSKLRKIEVPVFFRLLYSSGMRPIEARLLRRENINLLTGVIDVIYTKGYNEHRVVLHDTMLELLIQYDHVVSQIIPARKIFFPTRDDRCHHKLWVPKQFNEAWYKYNQTYARAGDFRHFYAFLNINSWTGVGYEIHDKLLALSKSMGHTSLRHTIYYFSFSDTFGDFIEEYNEEYFNDIIPDLPDEKQL